MQSGLFTRIIGLLIFVFSINNAIAANLSLETIDLEFRTGREIKEAVSGILSEHSTVTVNRNTLILRATPSDIAAVRRLLESIDIPPRQYIISVASKDQIEKSHSSYKVSGKIPVMKGKSIFFNKPGYRDSSSGQGVVQGTVAEKNIISTHGITKTVRALEGRKVFVGVANGSDGKRIVRKNINGTQTTTEIVSVSDLSSSGFYAMISPRNHGRVVVDLSNYLFERSIQSGVSSGEVGTSMYLRLGKWAQVNNIQTNKTSNNSGILQSDSTFKSGTQDLWIKVDEVR